MRWNVVQAWSPQALTDPAEIVVTRSLPALLSDTAHLDRLKLH
jgi:hypothetical protein